MKQVWMLGRSASQGGLTLGVLGLAVLLLLGVSQYVGAAPACGPGAHWVDTCPSGFDSLSTASHLTVVTSGGMMILLDLSGPTLVFRGDGMTIPDHHIDTEIVSLSLTGGGFTVNAGDGIANLLCDGPLCSLGRITELPGDPALAESFFDVNFEILGPFPRLHGTVREMAIIDQVPPLLGTQYVTVTPTPLFDDAGNVQAQLLPGIHHVITPKPSTLLLLGSGLAGIIGLGIRRRRSQKA
jgi:hypothetical protein